MGRLDDKVAIVTGAGSGIGRAIALLSGKEGARVAVADCIADAGEETVKAIKETGGEAIYIATDVSKAADVKNMIKTTVDNYGKLNVLYNNAGINGEAASTVDSTEENWEKVNSINLKGVWLGMKYAIAEMLKAGGGSIVNTASMCALVAMRGFPHYSATKGGVVALSRVTAMEYAKKNIRVNCILPGPTQTPINLMFERQYPEIYKSWETIIPVGRFARPEEIAQAALFLASDESSFVTGSALVVDGGVTASCLIHCPNVNA